MQKARWGDAGIGLYTCTRAQISHQPGTRNRFAVTAVTFEIDHRENARVKADAYSFSIASGARAATTHIKVNINK